MQRASLQLRIAAVAFAAGAIILFTWLLRGTASPVQPTPTEVQRAATAPARATAQLVPTAAAEPTAAIRAGVPPLTKDDCPPEYPIKGNRDSMIYHERGDRGYAATDPEVCFATIADARAAGFSRPEN